MERVSGIIIVVGALFLFLLAWILSACDVSGSGSESVKEVNGVSTMGTVVEVDDGDTVKVDVGERVLDVRVLGIDTPEVYFGVECYGPEASAFAKETLLGETVTLKTDPTQDKIDSYDRALRYIVLENGKNYSVLAARAGVAKNYVFEGNPVQLHDRIVAAENEAQAANRGLWKECE